MRYAKSLRICVTVLGKQPGLGKKKTSTKGRGKDRHSSAPPTCQHPSIPLVVVSTTENLLVRLTEEEGLRER